MTALDRVKPALLYIDEHLDEPLRIEDVAARFHFSPFYFHRVFTLIVGQSMAAYIRGRRLQYAALALHGRRQTLTDIAMQAGFETAQAFSRAFSRAYGMPPGAYRAAGIAPEVTPVETLLLKFNNRLQGGMYVNPKLIKKPAMRIAGAKGPGHLTAQVWAEFEAKSNQLTNPVSESGHEVRLWDGEENPVYAGYDIGGADAPEGFACVDLPAGEYASFEVFVAQGYDSENDAMEAWLKDNEQGYRRRYLGDLPFVVEYYDERFQGEESGSIVEIWVPVEK